ncbi:MAG TPA: rhomboid family intramembrane serine protease [Thiohalobacter sp.]|nr:rhomboid family intramembrane serine protease [Thiohalobacter sp.]
MFPLKDDNPAELPPRVTVTLIAACVLAFFWQLSLGQARQAAVFAFGTVPAVLFGLAELPSELSLIPAELTLVTSMFMHGGWLHLIGNMLYLWIFGNNVEDAMGHVRFIVFYLVCGLVAVLSHALPSPESTVPMIGASGAISGVLGAYLLLYPHARVLVAIPIGFIIQTFYLPAVAVLGLWFVMQLLNSATTATEGGGVAWGAHIGGFVAGMLLVPLFKRRNVPLWQRPGR